MTKPEDDLKAGALHLSLTPEQAAAAAADLQASLGDLVGLITGASALPNLLRQVATFAEHPLSAVHTGDLPLAGITMDASFDEMTNGPSCPRH